MTIIMVYIIQYYYVFEIFLVWSLKLIILIVCWSMEYTLLVIMSAILNDYCNYHNVMFKYDSIVITMHACSSPM